MIRALVTTLVVLFAATAGAQADHLQCFKVKDATAKASYTATLTPTDGGFPVAAGCVVRVPAKMLCIDVQKTITGTPTPPGAGPGNPAQKYLCYKVKCPKAALTPTVQDQFGSHALTVKSTSLLCAPEPAPTTTTSTTTNTTTTTVGCTPSPEACGNGIDDDCDGFIDELPCSCTTSAQCPPAPNAMGQCMAGQCTVSCFMPFANCNVNPVDGCEVNVQNDPANCGGCGIACPQFPNTTMGSCMGSMCTLGPCSPGYADCDGMTGTGCEVFIAGDPNNCGGCNTVCPTGFSCVNSVCTP
jgi:hypothetical protein